VLPGKPQRLPAGGQDPDAFRHRQQLSDLVGRLSHLLEVVEDQEELLGLEVLDHALDGRPMALLGKAQDLGHGGEHQAGIGDGGQGHEERTVLKLGEEVPGRLDGQPGLPGAARTCQGQEAGLSKRCLDVLQLPAAPDEARQLDGEVVRADVHRPEGGEIGGQTFGPHLVQVFGPGKVLEPMLAEIPERHPLGGRGCHQGLGGCGGDDLATVPGGGDAGRPMEIDAHVVVTPGHRLAGVHPHPDPDLGVLRPRMGRQGPLRFHRGGHRLGGRGEHHEEGVAVRRDLDAAPGTKGVTE
jgi:hypothetical protein